jgi:Rps23 Pro-64 3,4-dihydroxylase Tpa1-like proline 4-hydroxylase
MNIEYEKLADGLIYYKNIIENPQEIINQIEFLDKKVVEDRKNKIPKSFQTRLNPWGEWNHGEDKHFCKIKSIVRTSDLKENDYYYEEYAKMSDPLFKALDIAFEHYSKTLYPFAGRSIKGKEDQMNILKYEKSGYLPEHSDHGISSRTLSVILYLNDNYEGGEISFKTVGVTLKPDAGSIIFFPSNFIFTHEIAEMKSGVRYALPNWYHNMVEKIHSDGSE